MTTSSGASDYGWSDELANRPRQPGVALSCGCVYSPEENAIVGRKCGFHARSLRERDAMGEVERRDAIDLEERW